MPQAQLPLQFVADSDGDPSENGDLYIGIANLNPETNPISVYWDAAHSQLAAQPLKTSGGYIWRNGTPARVYVVPNTFSITLRDNHGVLVWSIPDAPSTFIASSIITQISTGFFYEDDGAHINRVNDRLFLGDATINDGNAWVPPPGDGGNQDYVSENIPQGPTTALAQMASLSTVGGMGVLGATRTSDGGGLGTQGSLGVFGFAVNDYTVDPVIAEAGYFEAQKKQDAGITTTVEIDSVNQGDYVDYSPYTNLFSTRSGQTFGLGIAAGGARTPVDNSSAALLVLNNGAAFGKGLVFSQLSLDTGEAISFPQNYFMQWYYPATVTLGTAVAATIGVKTIAFTAAATAPYVGQIVTFSDGNATFPVNTCVEIVTDATHVILNNAAIKNSTGLTMSGTVSQRTNLIQSIANDSDQTAITFTNAGIMLGNAPSTNGGLASAGTLQVVPVLNGTNYVTVQGSSGADPIIGTNGGNLVLASNTGIVNFAAAGNYIYAQNSGSGDPSIFTNGGSLFLSSNTGTVKIGNLDATPSAQITTGSVTLFPTVATPVGGFAGLGLSFGSTSNFGVYHGSGAPTLSAAKGSLYLRSDGSTTTDRMYVNTNGSTTWTAVTTVA